MDHATSAVAAPDTETVQVGDAFWQRAERRSLVQGAVRPVRVAEVLVLAQYGQQVPMVAHQSPVQQFAAAGAYPPFHDPSSSAGSARLSG